MTRFGVGKNRQNSTLTCRAPQSALDEAREGCGGKGVGVGGVGDRDFKAKKT